MSSNFNVDQLLTELNIDSDNSVEQTTTELSVADKKEVNINPDIIYHRLNQLIETGDNLLKTTQYLIQSSPDADNISSAASLISSIRDVVHEFTVIHRDKLKFDQQLQLEEYKANQKEKLLKLRLEHTSTPKNNDVSENMIEFSQESIIDAILKKELNKNT